MLYSTPLVLIYLISGSLYLLTVFLQFTISSPPRTSSNYKFIIFFYESVCLLLRYIINLQHVSSYCTTQRFDISIHFKMLTTVSLVTSLLPCKDIMHYCLYFPPCTFHTRDSIILQMKVCTASSPSSISFFPMPPSLSDNHMFVLHIYDSVSILLCLFICFLDSTYK